MKNRGFVFSTMGFLLIIPAVILAASFLHMVQSGSEGIGLVISGDKTFYTCNNVIDFLQTVAVEDERSVAIDGALLYAGQSGLNITITESNASYYTVLLQMANGMKCNKTIELRSGTLRLNLSLENYMALFNGAPIYVRTGGNSTMNITTYTTYPNSTSVDGADILVSGLEYITAESISGTSGSNGSGYFNYTLDINAEVDTSDSCWRKALLGEYTATATANLTNFYDGTDDESFYIWGIMSASITPYKKGSDMYVRVTLTDEYDDYIYSENCESETNVTYTDPYITIEVYSDNDDTTNPPNCAADPEFCPETGSAYDISLDTGSVKRYITDIPFEFDAGWYYAAYVSITMPDFMNGSGSIAHMVFQPLTFYDLGIGEIEYTTSGNKLETTIVNYGTQSLDNYTLEIVYSIDNGSVWNTCYNDTVTVGGSIPTPRKGSVTKIWCNPALDILDTNLINATLTDVGPQDEDPENDFNQTCWGNC